MATLEVTGLEIRYGHLVAVAGIDLRLADGEVVVVLGANGAGKSSTLNGICGALRPAGGTVVLDGRDVTGMPAHRIAKLGLVQVPEGRRIISPLTVQDNLLLGGYVVKARQRRDELLRSVYELFPILHERRERAGGVLSGGEQQMLAFGRALMSDPGLLLLDEPSMGLSPAMVEVVMDAVSEIAATRDLSILMVEQNATAALEVASRAYVMEQGEIVLEGPSAEVLADPLVLRAFLGIEEEPAVPAGIDRS